MIDTTDGKQSRQYVSVAVTNGRSYQIDKRTPSMKTTPSTTISSETQPPVPAHTNVEATPANQPREIAPVTDSGAQRPTVEATPVAKPVEEEEEVGPVKTVWRKDAVANADLYDMKPKPYKINTNKEELEFKCELCLDMPCCPEHCCDVSYPSRV